MEEVIRVSENIKNILIKHTRKKTVEESLNEILRNEITRKKKIYMIKVKHFESKYKSDFMQFETSQKGKDMAYELEKNYFDWDMAVTAVEDLEEELRLLESR
ncbi:MAG: hypothetical protein KAW12_00665 [Candidatus Aminicenantes bacterium]|nr:hypothetical protein [Candidatus Aminicenantes bacterium]